MRKPIIAGNWKMHKTAGEGAKLVQEINALTNMVKDVEIVVCPPFTTLTAVAGAANGTNIGLGAQNMHWEDKGAFTGEIAPGMLKDIGCTHVIIGHSERRQYFAETDQTVNNKLKAALKAGLMPIVCVGETLAEQIGRASCRERV
jgi:triosephosphate isomerase